MQGVAWLSSEGFLVVMNGQGFYFPVETTRYSRVGRVYAKFGLHSGDELAVIQNGLSVGESDKVLGFWISGRAVMVILYG